MNRQGPTVPSSMRGGGMPNQFAAQQQSQHGVRGISNRMPAGKPGGGAGWALSSVPMGTSGMGALRQQQQQQQQQHMFPERMVASGPGTPLDLSEFPTLGGNAAMNNHNVAGMWSGTRNLPGQMARNQPTPLQNPQPSQDEIYTPTSRLGAQGNFRFGNMQQPLQPPLQQQQSQQSHASGGDEFPPLNKNAAGEMGQERGAGMQSLSFNSQPGAGGRASASAAMPNGLLSAVSASSARANELRTASTLGAPGSSRGQLARMQPDGDSRQKNAVRDDAQSTLSSDSDTGPPGANPTLGAFGNDPSSAKTRQREDGDRAPEVVDPLAGMSESDKWGLKGLRTLMSNYPDYNALMTTIDPSELGLDLNTTEMISSQQWSVFDEVPPRPVVTKFRLPECYRVNNVAPLQTKITSFADDTLFYIFYSCTRDLRQQWAAQELFNRNWRWNRKLRVWLTKDEHTASQAFGTYERGIYIVWDTKSWMRDRRELVLHYADLDSAIKPAA